MSEEKNIDPFENEFENESSGDSLLSPRDFSYNFDLHEDEVEEILDFDDIITVPKVNKKNRSGDKNFIESEELEEDSGTVEINSKGSESNKNKAEVFINRKKNGELESIEVKASNGERILIKFEVEDEIENEDKNTEEPQENKAPAQDSKANSDENLETESTFPPSSEQDDKADSPTMDEAKNIIEKGKSEKKE